MLSFWLCVSLNRFVQDGRLVFMASLGENDLNAPPALKEFAGLLGVAVGRTGYAANDFDLLLLDCPMVSHIAAFCMCPLGVPACAVAV